MANLTATVAQAGAQLGLSSTRAGGLVFGSKDGYPVQLAARRTGNQEAVVEIIRYDDPPRDKVVLQAIYGSGGGPFKAKQLKVENGVVVYEHPRRLFRSLSAEAVAAEFETLLRAVKSAAPAPPAGCRQCRSSSGAEPILLDGLVDRVCPSCVERLQHEAKLNAARYESLPMNLPFAVVVAAILALVSAGVWAAIAIATNRMFWAVAIGSGLVIGWGTTRAAGKGGLPVQVTGALFTVLGVLLGEVFFIAWLINAYAQSNGVEIDWNEFAARVPGLLWDSGADTLFSLGGGLFGAWYAVVKAGKPKLDVSVEKKAA
ncbi:MAG TPA: hypothetical protein VGH16_23400 [Candidatus Binatia bacterium]|jgi:hypothetical protein